MLPLLSLLLLTAEQRPVVTFDPPAPRLGDLAIVYIRNADSKITRAPLRVFGYEFEAFRVGDELLRGILAIPMDIDPGEYPFEVVLPSRKEQATLVVQHREFDRSELQVSREFTQKKSKALLERLRKEERELKALFEPAATSPRFHGALERPVDGVVTAVFGTRRVFNGKVNSTHYGLDLDGKVGDPIRAAAAGKVVMSTMRWASGGTVILDHGGGLFTAYFHMSKRSKVKGNVVKAGEILGLVGKTGRVTGPHLHLAVLVRAVKVDEWGKPKGARSFFVEPETFLGRVLLGEVAYLEPGRAGSIAGKR